MTSVAFGGSRAEVGSSSNRASGFRRMARAMVTRCFSPPTAWSIASEHRRIESDVDQLAARRSIGEVVVSSRRPSR